MENTNRLYIKNSLPGALCQKKYWRVSSLTGHGPGQLWNFLAGSLVVGYQADQRPTLTRMQLGMRCKHFQPAIFIYNEQLDEFAAVCSSSIQAGTPSLCRRQLGFDYGLFRGVKE